MEEIYQAIPIPNKPQNHALEIGRCGQFFVMYDLLKHGYKAFLTDEGINYDVILEHHNKIIRLQVKSTLTTKKINKTYKSPKRRGRNYKKFYQAGEFEGFALVALDIPQVAYCKFGEQNSGRIILRDNRIVYKNNKSDSAKFFDDLTLERFLSNF